MTTLELIAGGLIATSCATVASLGGPDVWMVTSFLALGASAGVLWACLSKESMEAVKMNRARMISGMIGGICIPRATEFFSPWKFKMTEFDPLVLILGGFLSAVGSFYIMHAALRKIEKREKVIGGMLAKTLEKAVERSTGNEPEETKDDNKPGT